MNSTMELFKDIPILKVINKNIIKKKDIVINEKLYSIRINNEEIVSLYCLPVYLEELVLGILYQEKIIAKLDSIKSIMIDDEIGIINILLKDSIKNLNMLDRLKKEGFLAPDCTNSTLFSSISNKVICKPIHTNTIIKLDNLHILLKQFEKMSELYRSTGGTHSAALCSGINILFYNEDISRHNCIDKVIGWSFLKGVNLSDKIIITTGRLSASMVVKAIKSSIAILISRSAATWGAIDLANRYNLSLAGFARSSRLNIYTHSERFSL